jgi:hypothetical protein
VWAVAIESYNALLANSEVSKNRSESCGETCAFLRYDLDSIAYQASQFVLILLRAHHGDFHVRQRLCQRQSVL